MWPIEQAEEYRKYLFLITLSLRYNQMFVKTEPKLNLIDLKSFSNRGSLGSSDGQSTERHDSEEVENVFAYHSRSQTSLSSFGVNTKQIDYLFCILIHFFKH